MGSSRSGIYIDWAMLFSNDPLIREGQNQEPPDTNLDTYPHVAIADDEDFNLICPGWELKVMEQHLGRPSMAVQETLFPEVPLEFETEASLAELYSSPGHTERTSSEASRQKPTSSINFNDIVIASHTVGQPIPTNQKSTLATNFDAKGSKDHSPRCNYTKNTLVESKNGESPLDTLNHGFTFIVDPSATSQKTSAIVGKCYRVPFLSLLLPSNFKLAGSASRLANE
jgi:hypothetical protein